MRRVTAFLVLLFVSSVGALAQEREEKRLEAAATVLREILGMPETIPRDLLDRAECVIVYPGVKKLAIAVGGSYGRGAMTCRSGKAFDGPWSAPAMFALEGASIGFQLGGQETDFVLLVMNNRGVDSILRSKVKLGADLSAAAGPKGRAAAAATDLAMRSEILTYSRARGLFAGVSIEGSTLRADNDGNQRVYGRRLEAQVIVRDDIEVPAAAEALVDLLNERSPKNRSDDQKPRAE
jgi:lipid-binding SYLF domain-containing protein